MRFIHVFLLGYFVPALGIGLAVWQTGVLAHVAPVWIGICTLVTIGMGIMLSVASGRPGILSVASGRPGISEEIEK